MRVFDSVTDSKQISWSDKFSFFRWKIRQQHAVNMVDNLNFNHKFLDPNLYVFEHSGKITAKLFFIHKKKFHQLTDQRRQEILYCQRVPNQLQQVLRWKQGNDLSRLYKRRASSKSWWLGGFAFWNYLTEKVGCYLRKKDCFVE